MMETTKKVLEIVQIIAGIAFSFVGARVAWLGLLAWHRQMHGNARYEAAKALGIALRKFLDSFYAFRNPGWHRSEEVEAMEFFKVSEEDINTPSSVWVTHRRFMRLCDAWNDVANAAFEAEITISPALHEDILELKKVVVKLDVAMRLHASPTCGNPSDHTDIMWGDNADEISIQCNSIIERIQMRLAPIIRANSAEGFPPLISFMAPKPKANSKDRL
ncbi:MAG: hypothetical protein K8R88_09970 [Armatimonadetes bacterium]|nr:hypothetical protein [Armatimonadota bacterium]